MRRLRLMHKMTLVVLGAALLEGGMMGWMLYAASGPAGGYAFVCLVGGLGTLLTILLGLLVIRQVTRPLARLSAAAQRIGRGDLAADIDIRSRDEIGDLADAFREMQRRLRETYEGLERRVAERTAQLQDTTDFLDSVLNSATEYGILATDLEWRVLTFNEGARRLFGREPAEMLGRPLAPLLAPEAVERSLGLEARQALQHRGRYEGEGLGLRAGGERFPMRLVATRRPGRGGGPIGYTLICRDISSRKMLEDRLRRYTDDLERLVAARTADLRAAGERLRRAGRLKAQFLAGMSHELRTPLNAIIGFAETLRDGVGGPVTADQREFADDIARAGRHLLGMIDGLLDLARAEAGTLELARRPCDLAALIDEVLRVAKGLARPRGVDLRAEVQPRPLEIVADPLKMKQVLYHLVSNAVKFMDKPGTVVVEARADGPTVAVRVRDTGIGIAPEHLAAIFEEFTQIDGSLSRRRDGAGLGLAITKRLVELHGGDLDVESEVGRGSTFTVTLRRDADPGPAPHGRGPRPPGEPTR